MSLKQLRNVDKRTKYAVYGWMRNKEKELRLSHTPAMISSICILYLSEDEIFGIIGKDTKLSNNKKCIIKRTTGADNSSYGMKGIDSMLDCICKYDLKISKTNRAWSIKNFAFS